jgi:GH24 family phage-related lysozyme (muramidase)
MNLLTRLLNLFRPAAAAASATPAKPKSRIGAKATGSAAALATIVAFVGTWEGLSLKAYQDIVGVWTVCYGETRGVTPADVHTKEECDTMLADGLRDFERQLDACLLREDQIPLETKIAFVSWAYNVGVGAACRSTLVRYANAGDLEAACNELPRWNRAGGQVVRGLTNRRVSERSLCLQGLKA